MKRQAVLDPDPVDARQFEVTVKQLANSLTTSSGKFSRQFRIRI